MPASISGPTRDWECSLYKQAKNWGVLLMCMAHITEFLHFSLHAFIYECPFRSQNQGLDKASAAFAPTPHCHELVCPELHCYQQSRQEPRLPTPSSVSFPLQLSPLLLHESSRKSSGIKPWFHHRPVV